MKTKEKRVLYIVAAIILLIEVFLHISCIFHRSFWTDELFTISFIKDGRSLAEVLKIFITFEVVNPPLYFILFYFWYRLVPHVEWILLLPSVVTFFVGVCLTAFFVSDITKKNKLAVLITLCILPLNSFIYTIVSIQARAYSLMFMLSAAFLLCYFRTRKNDIIRNIIITGIVVALLSFTHYLGALMAAYYGLIDIFMILRKKIKGRNIIIWMIPLFTTGSYLLASLILGRSVASFWPETPGIKILLQTVSWLFGSKLLLLITVVCVALIMIINIKQKEIKNDVIIYILLGDVAFVLLSVYIYSVYINPAGGFFVMRYFTELIPACVAVTVYSVIRYTKSLQERDYMSGIVFAVVFLCALIPNIGSLLNYSFHGDMRKKNTSELLYEYYKDPDKDVVVLHNTDAFYRADGFKEFYMDGGKNFKIVDESDEQALKEADRIFYVTLTYEESLAEGFAGIVKDYAVKDFSEDTDLYIYSR